MIKSQIELRKEILENVKALKEQAINENTKQSYLRLIEILDVQLAKLINNEIRVEKVKERVNNFKLLQTKEDLENAKILVVDINYLLPEHKDSTTDEIREFLEFTYGYSVLLIDGSRINIHTMNKDYKPVYFI